MTHPVSAAQAAENRTREEIARIGADLYSRRYTVGSAGNISARLDDGWLITPTDACLGQLDPAKISKVAHDGQWVSGDKPSKTLALHRNVYEVNPSVNGVVHTHSTHLVALTLAVIVVVRPLYTGTATVLIDPHRQEVINLNDNTATLRGASTDEAAVQSQVLLMQSAEVLRRVVKEQNLTADPDFMPQPSLLGPLKKLFSSGHKAEGLSAQDIAVMNAVDLLQKRLKVSRQQSSYLVDINVGSHDPTKAARVADAVANAYLAELVKGKVDSVKVAAGWMDQQLNDLKSRVHDADKAVEDYRAQHKLVMTQGVTVNDQQIADLNTQLIQARAEAAQAKAKYDQVAQVAKDHVDPGSLPEALPSETIARAPWNNCGLVSSSRSLS